MLKKLLVVLFICTLLITGCSSTSINIDAPLLYEEQINLGYKLLEEGKYEEAILSFHKAIEIEPMNVRGYMGAAEAYIGLEQVDEAIAILQKGFEKTEDDEIRNMLDVLLFNDNEDLNEMTSAFSDENFYEVSHFFEHIIPRESLTIGSIPFYQHAEDFEQESFREYGVQLRVREDEVFAFVGSENFNEFAGLIIGMELNSVLNNLGFTQEGVLFIKEAQSKNSNASITFYLSENAPNIVEAYVGDSNPYDLSISINYYDSMENFSTLYLVIGFYDNQIHLLEAHAVK